MTDGRKLFIAIKDMLLESNLSDIQRAKVLDTSGGIYEPIAPAMTLLEVTSQISEGRFEEAISLLKILPAPKVQLGHKVVLKDGTTMTYKEYVTLVDGLKPEFSTVHENRWEQAFIHKFNWIVRNGPDIVDKDKLPEKLVHEVSAKGLDILGLPHNTVTNNADLLLLMGIREFRFLSGIYKIELKKGGFGEFIMNSQQRVVYNASQYLHPRILLLKSRQTGASTLYLIKALDDILTNEYFMTGLVSKDLESAKELKKRAKKAYESMPSIFLDALGVTKTVDNAQELTMTNNSTLKTEVSFRSGTLQSLHVSEVGAIAAKDPIKAEELETGTLQAIALGQQVIFESTAMGMDNYFHTKWEIASDSYAELGFDPDKLAPQEFLPVFLSCWDDNTCTVEATEERIARTDKAVWNDVIEFFNKTVYQYSEATGRKLELSNGQKIWWWETFRAFGYDWNKMGQEYPDVPLSAFAAGKDGSYYSEILYKEVKAKGHIIPDLYDKALDTYCGMDLGHNDATVIVWYQVFKKELRIIDCYAATGATIGHFAKVIKDKGYGLTRAYLPHDSKAKVLSSGGATTATQFRQAGVPNVVLSKTSSVQDDINQIRTLMPNIYFDTNKTALLLRHLGKYKKQWDENLQSFKEKPYHDEASDFADAFRYAVLSAHKYHRLGSIGTKTKFKSNVVDGMAM